MAAFPRVTYCLASATLTDAAVADIQSNHERSWNRGILIQKLFRITGYFKGLHEDSVQVTQTVKHLSSGFTAPDDAHLCLN